MKHSPQAIEGTPDPSPHRRTIKGEHQHPRSTPPHPFLHFIGLARTWNCACAISVWSRGFAAIVPRPHRRPSSGEHPLDTGTLPSPFCPYHGKPSCPRVAARLSSGEPWPLATVESTMDPWTGHPCVVHNSVDRVHAFFFQKYIHTRKPLPLLQRAPCSSPISSRSPPFCK
jgi:hypothetical protein